MLSYFDNAPKHPTTKPKRNSFILLSVEFFNDYRVLCDIYL